MLVSVCAVFLATLRSQAQTITWLGILNGGSVSDAYAVSADGSVVVGHSTDAAGQSRAFRWTQTTGMQDLGTLGGTWSEAYGVSSDGSVVVGYSTDAAGQYRAFRWTAAGGMQDLGTLGGTWSKAYGVSSDGSVVVGSAQDAAGQSRAFRWTPSGMEDLNRTYAHLLPRGLVLLAASAISPDGRYIVGQGNNAATGRVESFLLDTQGSSNVAEGSSTANLTLSLSPHPVQERATVTIYLAAGARGATLVLYDAFGRQVATLLQDAVLPAGTTAVPVSVGHLPSGTYTVVLRTSAGTVARQMVIAR